MALLSDSNLLNIRHYNCMQVKSVMIRIFDSIINSLLLEKLLARDECILHCLCACSDITVGVKRTDGPDFSQKTLRVTFS